MLINQKNDSSADEESSQSSLTANNHLFSLPAETLSLICKYLNAQDTQALSLTSKRVRSIILRLYLDTPILLPLTRKIYHEIQLKITRTLVLNTHEYDPGWIRKVLGHFKNVTTIEVATKNITQVKQIKGILSDSHKNKLQAIYVDKAFVSRWQSLLKRVTKDTTLTVMSLPDGYQVARRSILEASQGNDYRNPLLPKEFHKIPRVSVQDWMAPVSNMIDKFNRFKQLSVNQFKSTGTLFTPLQVMALNNIFFFSPSAATDYTVDLQDWEEVVNDCREKYQVYFMSDDVGYKMGFAIEKYSNMAYYSLTKIDEYVNTLKDSDMNKNVLRMLESISRRIYHNIDHTLTEDGFILNIIDPIISAYFDNSIPLLQYQGSDYEMPESKARKVAQARRESQNTSHVSGRKADRSALIDISNHEHKHTAYICEIKTEGTSKHRPDLPKIAAMLKDMLNEALKCNVSHQNYSVLGILIEGTQGTVLAMDLPYEKMYRLIEVDIFNLPRSTKELRYLSSVVKPLLNMKELVKKNVSTMLPLQYSLSSTSSNHGIMTETNKSPTYYTEYYK